MGRWSAAAIAMKQDGGVAIDALIAGTVVEKPPKKPPDSAAPATAGRAGRSGGERREDIPMLRKKTNPPLLSELQCGTSASSTVANLGYRTHTGRVDRNLYAVATDRQR